MKTSRCNLTKACQIFATFTELFDKYMGILPEKFQEVSPLYYMLVYITGICWKLEFVSILT